MKYSYILITLFIATILPSCNMPPEKKRHYAKKYSTMVVSDVAIGYTCKTMLALGTPACMVADVAADVALVTYYNNKYNSEQEKKAEITGETFEHKTFEWKESILDFAVFFAILVIIP